MNKPIEKKRIGPRRVNPKVRSNLDVQNSKITFSAKDERHIFHIFFTRGFRSRVTGPLPRNNLFKAHTYAHTHTHTHTLPSGKNPPTTSTFSPWTLLRTCIRDRSVALSWSFGDFSARLRSHLDTRLD